MKIPYGETFVEFELPEQIKWQVLKKDVPFSFSSQSELLQRGINDLVKQLEKHISHGAKLLLIVPDHTRKCNLPLILPLLIDALDSRFGAIIEILVANGSHILQQESVIRDLVSAEIYDSISTSQHDAKETTQLDYFGETSFGTEIWLNKKINVADYIITIGGILYHYFAGFGGGPKMLFPGVAGYESIRQNHSLTIDKRIGLFHPQSREGEIDKNPVYSDLSQVLNVVPNVLSLQVVLSQEQKIVQCKCGPVLETQRLLIPYVKNNYGITMKDKADIVIAGAGGFPADVNLIQAHKAIRHACHIIRKKGVLIFFARCKDGIGSKTFMPVLKHGSAKKIGEMLANKFQINGQTALSLKEKAEEFTIFLISDIEASVIRQTGMTPCRSWEEAWNRVADKRGKLKTGFIMPQAAATVPLNGD